MDEDRLRELWRRGERAELVTGVLGLYGREILSYLLATLRGEGEAGDAFSQFTLNLWQASEGFRGESSFRTWAYALARHAAGRVIRERGRQRRQIPLSQVPEVDAMAARLRSETREHLKSETRDRVRRLRDDLDPDDQTLLILRIDRGFAWPDVARVLARDGEDVERKIVSLRKRFERLKERLRKLARPGE
jgi:RNA polymerase sigma-70 factor (ECF subfamily)